VIIQHEVRKINRKILENSLQRFSKKFDSPRLKRATERFIDLHWRELEK